ncbi:hypothetical protein [Salinimicrobium sp. WS361]|uniref:hypothetical protein n=1 Tax=Salinimicrobium sp. WS361 TaxID=3425123 RepID=UPI003D6DB953
MKYYVIIFFIFLLLPLQAQERSVVQGIVKNNDSLLKNVHINNVSSGKLSVSGEKGLFQLKMKTGDTLVMSHVGMNDLISFIKADDLQKSPLYFRMIENSQELGEVVIDENSEINVVSLGIIPKKIEKLSMNERRLETAGDFKFIHLLSLLGGSLEIDPILNAINGRTKKLKRNIKIEKEQRNIAFLETHHKPYMLETMQLTSGEAALLIDFALERKELQALLEEKNDAAIKLFLHDCWFHLSKRMESSK